MRVPKACGRCSTQQMVAIMVITQQNAAASLPAQWHWAVCCQQTKRSEEAGQRGRCLESLTGLPPGSSFPLHGHCTLHWGEQAETGEARTGRNRDCRLRGTLRSNAGVGAFSLGKLPAPTFVGEVARTLLGLWMLLAPGLRNSWGQHICPAVRHNGRTPSGWSPPPVGAAFSLPVGCFTHPGLPCLVG